MRALDSTDKDILRLLSSARRPLSGYAISVRVRLSAPSISRRLARLKNDGILRVSKTFKQRSFFRTFRTKDGERTVQITSAAKVLWEIDLEVHP